jgi:RHS repeat-associated protein
VNFSQAFFPFGVKYMFNELFRYGVREKFFYCRDHLGSIREVVKSAGGTNTLVARYDYDPYGKRLTQYQSSSYTGGCDFGYTGHITAPSLVAGQTELVLTHFRAYDPNLGRWLSADPIGEAAGMNLYAYVGGNPLNFRDPLGLASWHDHYVALTTGWTWGEAGESLGIGAMATADGFIPFSDPFKESGGYSGCEDGAGFSKGAGQVVFGATALAGGTGIWSRVGLPTMSVGGTIGTGGGFHAFYGVTAQGTSAWMHGVLSAQTGLMVVSEASAGIGTFSTYWNTLSGIPIIFPAAAAAIGMKSSNCVTAAGSALGRGWFGN